VDYIFATLISSKQNLEATDLKINDSSLVKFSGKQTVVYYVGVISDIQNKVFHLILLNKKDGLYKYTYPVGKVLDMFRRLSN